MFCKALGLLYHDLIKPRIEAGKSTVCSRYWGSCKVYQGLELGTPLEYLYQKEAALSEGYKPDLIVLLNVDPEEIYRRVIESQRNQHVYNKPNLEKFQIRHQGFLYLAKKEIDKGYNWIVLDGNKSIEQVEEGIWSVVANRFGLPSMIRTATV